MSTGNLPQANALFTTIDDAQAELVQGGGTMSEGLRFKLTVNPSSIEICFSLNLPGFSKSSKIIIGTPSWAT